MDEKSYVIIWANLEKVCDNYRLWWRAWRIDSRDSLIYLLKKFNSMEEI